MPPLLQVCVSLGHTPSKNNSWKIVSDNFFPARLTSICHSSQYNQRATVIRIPPGILLYHKEYPRALAMPTNTREWGREGGREAYLWCINEWSNQCFILSWTWVKLKKKKNLSSGLKNYSIYLMDWIVRWKRISARS